MRFTSRLALGFVLATVGVAPALAQAPKKGGTLTFAVTGEPPSTDCHAITTYAAVHVLAPHYSLLLRIDQDNFPKLEPDLATSWTVSPDGLTYTFKLRTDALFHDGSKVTSKDIQATFDRIRKPPQGIVSIRKAAFEDITAIETPDPATVVFKIKSPDSAFLDALSLPYNCIYSADELAKDPNYPAQKVMGSGPFLFVENVKGSHWIGKRNDKYFLKDKPYLDGFKAVFIKAAAVPAAIQGSQIDAEFRSITPGERDQIAAAMKDKVVIQESPWVCKVEVLFNAEKKPFDNPKVRQALQMSIDRWGASTALSKVAILKPVGGPLRPGSEMALPPDELAKLPAFSRDMEKARAEAKKLLAEAGVTDLKFKLVNRNTSQPFTPAGIYVIDQWRRIGVAVEHQQLEVSLQKKAIAAGDYDGAIEAFCADSDDPKPLLLQHLSKSRSPRNMTRNENKPLDELFDRYKAAQEPAQQKSLLADIQRNIISEGYDVPLLWYSRIVAHSSAMKGWKVTPSHFANQDLASVWLDR